MNATGAGELTASMLAAKWPTPPSELSVPNGAVHVWRAGLDLEASHLRCLRRHLSADERARASRFRFARDRERFIAARGSLREILALYLGTAARRLAFRQGPRGKPFLGAYPDLRFNVSHSLDTMLVAVAHRRELGVDVEHVDAGIAIEEVDVALSPPEKRVLSRFHGEGWRTALLRLWTRKEAYVKADGRGMSLPLEHVDVSGVGGRAAVLDETTGQWQGCARWTLQTLAVDTEYLAAVAAEGGDWELACWQWRGSASARSDPSARLSSASALAAPAS